MQTQSGFQAAMARIREITAPLTPAQSGATGTSDTQAFASQLALAQAQSGSDTSSAADGGDGLSLTTTLPTAATVTTPAAASVAATATAAPAGTGTAGATGQRIAQIATAELGVSEQPPGSNNGTRIAEYRTATANSGVGPWCAYFCSWVARQAGVPIGPNGQGEGWVPNVEAWGKQTNRWIPSGSSTHAQAGDLVVFDRNGDGEADHIGVVTGVRSDGGISTVEGNSSNAVSARSYGPGQWVGLVRLAAAGS
ncbi:MAG: CHAP domain-containing protein [Thermoleophilia bacterium]